jgi:hypothetical protein
VDVPRFSRSATIFMIAVPVAWAIVLVFHPSADDPIYESLRDDVSAWLVVHYLTLLAIGLIGAVMYLLVRDMPGTAARVSLLAIPPFILFYAAGEAILGIATGVIVDNANGFTSDEQALAGEGAQALWDDFLAGDLLIALGGIAWITSALSASIAYRRAGASTTVVVLLALSALVAFHDPPIGPVGCLIFAAAVALVTVGRRGEVTAGTERAEPAASPSSPA